MKRYKWPSIIIILILFIGLSIIPSSGFILVNKTYTINSNGTILYVGGGGPGNYSTIQSAIDNASNGDTIFVFNESYPYYENVRVYKCINLIGENRNTTVINGVGDLSSTVSIVYDANNVLVSGFTITCGYLGIGISSNNNVIRGNKINFNDIGIKIGLEDNNNVITNNIIVHNSKIGIFDDCRDSGNIVKWNVIGGNGRERLDFNYGGIFKHRSGGIFHHNDFDLNWGANAFTEHSYSGVWDDGSEGNYWDDWESNPGYPNEYIIKGTLVDQIDKHPNATSYFNHPIVCTESSYEAEPGKTIIFKADVNILSSSFSWFWEFGDGNTSNEKRPHHAYNKSGIYQVNVTITDNKSVSDTDKSIAHIGIPPNKPTIKGPTKGRPNHWYDYSIIAIDPDSDYLYYYIDWGDHYYDYIGPNLSGEVVKAGHAWDYNYNYTIRVKAIDETLIESEWGTFDVNIARGRMSVNSLFHWFFERFPLLERLFSFIK